MDIIALFCDIGYFLLLKIGRMSLTAKEGIR